MVEKADRGEPAWQAENIPDGQECGMIEFFDHPQTFVERELECRDGSELRPNREALVRDMAVRVANTKAVAQSVPEKKVVRERNRFRGRHVHNLCTAEFMPARNCAFVV